ncbi:hypothetical protein HNP46_000493 [Pseudomonas nitritireducens]|uniref:Uncharacterized protein n=1 Tax=Pseudomonas nitroreducens TaxID=46680 RepID=A0A7W7NZX5_PSENT|nr:hypothetical protein [Pseudomonas nitritireducens]MBB4861682.1 hypothetical protein [Pseudomonas nitritireducens]
MKRIALGLAVAASLAVVAYFSLKQPACPNDRKAACEQADGLAEQFNSIAIQDSGERKITVDQWRLTYRVEMQGSISMMQPESFAKWAKAYKGLWCEASYIRSFLQAGGEFRVLIVDDEGEDKAQSILLSCDDYGQAK